ncbi:MAG: hypothetical protein V7459_00675 [Oceanicoccus sp.]
MNPWSKLGVAEIPNGGGTLTLSQREQEFSIHLSGVRGELMNSRVHNSEEALAELGCAHLAFSTKAQVLVGGLGMGFTLTAALRSLPDSAQITVAELIPEVVEWNRGPLGECANNPLRDPRTHVHQGDVAECLTANNPRFDAILLDVDNGPEGITHSDNNWLYSAQGLDSIFKTLRPEGMLAIWSAGFDPMFVIRLKKARYNVTTKTVRARQGKGSRHTIFLAQKP